MTQSCSDAAEFIARHWERAPMAQPCFGPFAPPSADAVFDAVVAYCRHRTAGVRFYRGSELQSLRVGSPLLPKAEDGTFEAYNQRVVTLLGDDNYTFVINNLQQGSADLHRWARGVSRAVFAERGMNQGGAGLAIFVGNYIYSAFPVHFDHENIFHFPIVGEKRIRTWPRSYIDQHPELHETRDYAAHLAGSQLLCGDPGDVLYWPKHAWHVGESAKGFSVSLALGMSAYHSALVPLMSKLSALGSGPLDQNGSQEFPDDQPTPSIPVDLRDPARDAEVLPESYAAAWAQLQQMLSPAAMHTVWLQQLSSDGFGAVDVRGLPDELLPDDRLRYMAPSVVVHKQMEGFSLVATNGIVTPHGESPEIFARVAEFVADHDGCTLDEVRAAFPDISDALPPVIERLLRADVLRLAPTEH